MWLWLGIFGNYNCFGFRPISSPQHYIAGYLITTVYCAGGAHYTGIALGKKSRRYDRQQVRYDRKMPCNLRFPSFIPTHGVISRTSGHDDNNNDGGKKGL